MTVGAATSRRVRYHEVMTAAGALLLVSYVALLFTRLR
jgi:hypothetical protein